MEATGYVVLDHARLQVAYWVESQRGTAMSVHQRYQRGLARLREEARRVRLPRPIGRRLVEMGIVTEEDVNRALEQQRAGSQRMLLGEILVQRGVVDPQVILDALHEEFQTLESSETGLAQARK